jgi:hypothetical protein
MQKKKQLFFRTCFRRSAISAPVRELDCAGLSHEAFLPVSVRQTATL